MQVWYEKCTLSRKWYKTGPQLLCNTDRNSIDVLNGAISNHLEWQQEFQIHGSSRGFCDSWASCFIIAESLRFILTVCSGLNEVTVCWWYSGLLEPTSVTVRPHFLSTVSGTYRSQQTSWRRHRVSAVRSRVQSASPRLCWSTAQHVRRRTRRSK